MHFAQEIEGTHTVYVVLELLVKHGPWLTSFKVEHQLREKSARPPVRYSQAVLFDLTFVPTNHIFDCVV